MKIDSTIRDVFSFDDVLLQPLETGVKPDGVKLSTRLTKSIDINIPLIAAPADNVTESALAIRMAQLGGIGFIHDNMPLGKQVEEVRRVKKAEGTMAENPITIAPNSSLAEAIDLLTSYKVSGLPVVDPATQKVVGIVTDRDVRYFDDYAAPVSSLMTADVVTAPVGIHTDAAKRLMHEKRIKKLVIVDDQHRPVGLMTVKDLEKMTASPLASRDAKGMLRVGGAVGLGKDGFDRASAMADAGVDVVMVDVSHAHTRDAIGTVSRIRQLRSTDVQIIAGNVMTADAARSLVDAGADAIKVGVGPTPGQGIRRLGLGMPQLSAVLNVVEQCSMMNVPVIVDGDVGSEANIIKALAAGAHTVMVRDLFAGTQEAPGEVFYHDMKAYKVVTPSARPQRRPKAATAPVDPYFVEEEAIDTSVPYRGPLAGVVAHMTNSIRMAMAYAGSEDLFTFREKSLFVRAK